MEARESVDVGLPRPTKTERVERLKVLNERPADWDGEGRGRTGVASVGEDAFAKLEPRNLEGELRMASHILGRMPLMLTLGIPFNIE